MPHITPVIPVKEADNPEIKTALKARRQMDRTQYEQVKSVSTVGTYDHLKTQSVVSVLEKPSQFALNVYKDLFDDKKPITGPGIRKTKIKDLNLTEGVYDE